MKRTKQPDGVDYQWLQVPVGDTGEVAINDKVYRLTIHFVDEQAVILLDRLSGKEPIEYRLSRIAGSDHWHCNCPAAHYGHRKECKHATAVAGLVRQLIAEYGSPEPPAGPTPADAPF